jgi:hypothetical protein
MVVVKQPRIDFLLAQGGLNGGEVHGQSSIVSNALRFPRILHFTLQAADRFVRFAQESRGFNRAQLLRERLDERRPVLEEHALQRFEVKVEFADLFLLAEKQFVNSWFIHDRSP